MGCEQTWWPSFVLGKKLVFESFARPRSLALLLMLLLTGCGGEPMGRVSGKVTFEDQPLTRGRVMFADKARGVYMTALIQEDGTYRVEMAQGVGLPLGEYQVAVSPPPSDHPIGPILNPPKVEAEPLFPLSHRAFETSPLKLKVEPGQNTFNIDLKPDP